MQHLLLASAAACLAAEIAADVLHKAYAEQHAWRVSRVHQHGSACMFITAYWCAGSHGSTKLRVDMCELHCC